MITLFYVQIVIYLDCLHRAAKIRVAMRKLKAERGKPRIRATSAAVIIRGLKTNKYSNQTEELNEKYKPGRHNPKVRELRKQKEVDAAAAADIEEFVTPENTSTMNTNWLPEQSDFESFLLTTSTSTMDENDFNNGMESIFGKVSKNNKPIICVTFEHIKQLESLRDTLSRDDQFMITFWIHRLQHHLVVDSSDGRQSNFFFFYQGKHLSKSFFLDLQVYLNGVFESVQGIDSFTVLPEDFNNCMADLVGDLPNGERPLNRCSFDFNHIEQLKVIRKLLTDHEIIDSWITCLEYHGLRRSHTNKSTVSVKDTGPPLVSTSSSGSSSIIRIKTYLTCDCIIINPTVPDCSR